MISCTVIFIFAPEQIPIKLEDDIEMQMMSPEDQITFLEKCMGEVQKHLPDTLIEYTGIVWSNTIATDYSYTYSPPCSLFFKFEKINR